MEGKQLSDLTSEGSGSVGREIPVNRSYAIPITVIKRELHNVFANLTAPLNPLDGITDDRFKSDAVSHHKIDNPERTTLFERNHPRFSTIFKSYPENLLRSTKRVKSLKAERLRHAITPYVALVLAVGLLVQYAVPVATAIRMVQARTSDHAHKGLSEIELSQKFFEQRDFAGAGEHLRLAATEFGRSRSYLRIFGQESATLPILLGNDKLGSAAALLTAAEDLSSAGALTAQIVGNVSSALDQTDDTPETNALGKVSLALQAILKTNDSNKQLAIRVTQYIEHAQQTLDLYAKTPLDDPSQEKARTLLLQKLPSIAQAAHTTLALLNQLPSLLGEDQNRRYLILFLNNSELRPGGGFIGSFATTILKKGSLDSFAVETNIYKRDYTFGKLFHVDSPEPIAHVIKDWYMRDANWSVDFATGAKQTAWFFKQEGGTDVDGVLAIDTTTIISLLEHIGSIDIPSQHVTINAKNFLEVVQYKVEKEYLENPAIKALNEPKRILADMFPLFLQGVFSHLQSNPQDILGSISTMAQERHLLFTPLFSQDPDYDHLQLGTPIPTKDDFLMVSNANIGGLKSSLNIDEQVDIALEPTDHNTLLHTITITRTHHGSYTWPDGDNHNFTRLVVPLGARYISSQSDGIEMGVVEEEAAIETFDHYQTFGRWLTTPVGATKKALFKYEVPIETDFFGNGQYVLAYLKQPGWLGDDVILSVKNLNAIFFGGAATSREHLTKDHIWRIPFERATWWSELPDISF